MSFIFMRVLDKARSARRASSNTYLHSDSYTVRPGAKFLISSLLGVKKMTCRASFSIFWIEGLLNLKNKDRYQVIIIFALFGIKMILF